MGAQQCIQCGRLPGPGGQKYCGDGSDKNYKHRYVDAALIGQPRRDMWALREQAARDAAEEAALSRAVVDAALLYFGPETIPDDAHYNALLDATDALRAFRERKT